MFPSANSNNSTSVMKMNQIYKELAYGNLDGIDDSYAKRSHFFRNVVVSNYNTTIKEDLHGVYKS